MTIPYLQIRLLGGFHFLYNAQPVDVINWPRVHSLLAYLVLHPGIALLRQHLAFMLWPDSDEAQARTNLRVLLHRLRKDFPPIDAFLDIERASILWRAESPYSLDVASFEAALTRAETATVAQALRFLEQTLALYTGALLPDLYDDWILAERDRLHHRFLQALTHAVDRLDGARRYAEAIEVAQRLLAADPLRETSHRRLMQLHAAKGDRAAALQIYHACASLLERELGVAPSTETCQIYERLLQTPQPAPVSPALRVPQLPGLVGRQEEWRLLRHTWRQVQAAQPQCVLIWGEAGMGKTRLAEELVAYVGRQGYLTATTRSYQAEGALAYTPIAQWLRTPSLREAVEQIGDLWRVEVARLVPEVLAARPDLPTPGSLRESWQRQRFYEALVQVLRTARQPLLLHIDDLQWTDTETLTWLHYLLRCERMQLLLVGTARVEEVDDDHPLHVLLQELRRHDRLLEITVEALNADDAITLAEQTIGETLSPDEHTLLWEQTKGHPLFLVETMRARSGNEISDSATTAIETAMPKKIHAVISTRLRGLSLTAQKVAALAAVMGRSFCYTELRNAGDTDEDALVAALDELWQRRILREQANGYDFGHDRIREVAYKEIPVARRRMLHRAVARALVATSENDTHATAAQIASHFELGGDGPNAATYYRQAAASARQLNAIHDEITYLHKSLTLLTTIPATPARDRQELSLQMWLGATLMQTHGPAPEAEQAYQHALKLCHRLKDRSELFPALAGLQYYHQAGTRHQQALDYAQQMLELANEQEDESMQMEAHGALGVSLYYIGRFSESQAHLERSVALHESHTLTHDSIYTRYRGSGLAYWAFLGRVLWLRGYPDRARRMSEETIKQGMQSPNPGTQIVALSYASRVFQRCRKVERVKEIAAEILHLSTQHMIPHRAGLAVFLQGWAMAEEGKGEEAIPLMQEGLALWRSVGTATQVTDYLISLAAAHEWTDIPQSGLPYLAEAQALMADTGECFLEAELHRVHGRLLFALGDVHTAEEFLVKALSIGQQQQALSLALRAATDLGRLYCHLRQISQARDVIVPILHQFTEGLDTVDIMEARQLLVQVTEQSEI